MNKLIAFMKYIKLQKGIKTLLKKYQEEFEFIRWYTNMDVCDDVVHGQEIAYSKIVDDLKELLEDNK